MTLSSIQLRKEIRPLLLPWIVVMLAGALSLLHKPGVEYYWHYVDILSWVLPLGCFFAIPLLAAIPLGSEFQYGTFSPLLAQPADRQTLWLQKVTITLLAVLPASSLFLLSARINPEFEGGFWPAAVWIFSSVAGSVAGTLIARSTIGGLALSGAFQGLAFLIWDRLAETQRHNGNISPVFLAITTGTVLCYATGMVLLGRKIFLRFEAVEGGHTGIDEIPGATFLSRIGANWLRCRPRGAFLNLLRREFHLLRTVWLLGLLSLLMWICLVVLGILRPYHNDFRAPVATGIAATLSFAIAILAGALPLGEEKNWGTHSWQLTLPVSPSVQWLAKLLVALFTSVICAALVPLSVLLVSGWLAGAPLLYFGDTPGLWFYPLASVLITLIAYWASCAVKGTVHAVVGFFTLLFTLAFVISFSPWLAFRAASSSPGLFTITAARFDPIHAHHVASVLMGTLGGSGFSFGIYGEAAFPLTVVLLAAVGLMQSRRMFRDLGEQTKKYVVRRLISLFAVCLLPSLMLAVFSGISFASYRQEEVLLIETHKAIETIQLNTTSQELDWPQRLTTHDLEIASRLSEVTLRWLNRSHIVVMPEAIAGMRPPRVQWPYESGLIIPLQPGARIAPYSATIITESGHTCNLRFWAEESKSQGILFESCQ